VAENVSFQPFRSMSMRVSRLSKKTTFWRVGQKLVSLHAKRGVFLQSGERGCARSASRSNVPKHECSKLLRLVLRTQPRSTIYESDWPGHYPSRSLDKTERGSMSRSNARQTGDAGLIHTLIPPTLLRVADPRSGAGARMRPTERDCGGFWE
jgi:hypothetical protein